VWLPEFVRGLRLSADFYKIEKKNDLFVRYRLPARNRVLAGLELTFGAKNAFDKTPPVDMSTSRYYSTLGDPRMRRLYVNVKKAF